MYLPKLHDKVEEMRGGRVLGCCMGGGGLEKILDRYPLSKTTVESTLTGGQTTTQVHFNLQCKYMYEDV